MEYKNQTENRAFQEMLQAAVKRLQNRSGEEIAAKSGAVFHSSRNVLEIMSFYETIEIQLPEFYINSDIDEWHYLTLLHYLDMADGTEGSQKLITFGNLKDGLIRGTKFDRTAEQKLEKLLQDKDPEKIQKACKNLGAEFTETKADLCAVFPVFPSGTEFDSQAGFPSPDLFYNLIFICHFFLHPVIGTIICSVYNT